MSSANVVSEQRSGTREPLWETGGDGGQASRDLGVRDSERN